MRFYPHNSVILESVICESNSKPTRLSELPIPHPHLDVVILQVPVLSDPGLADMTADVDFSLLGRVASGVKGVRTHGPVGQGQFLGEMGISERLQALADQPHVTEEQVGSWCVVLVL